MFFIDMKTHSFIDHTSHAVILKYACSSNLVNIYACVKRYTPATIWLTFIFIFLYQIINIRYIPFNSLY